MVTGLAEWLGLSWNLIFPFLSIIVIDLILAGDNAVIIAMAVKSLPEKQRRPGILIGTAGAVVLRVAFVFVTAKLLEISFIKFCGGLVIGWIAVKLFMEGTPGPRAVKDRPTLGKAVTTIVIADLSMSVDNILAIAGASKGNPFLLLFGLGLSIPLVVFASSLLSALMDRYPLILYIGAAVLGNVAGDMMISDPFIEDLLHPGPALEYGVRIAGAGLAIGLGRLFLHLRGRQSNGPREPTEHDSSK